MYILVVEESYKATKQRELFDSTSDGRETRATHLDPIRRCEMRVLVRVFVFVFKKVNGVSLRVR